MKPAIDIVEEQSLIQDIGKEQSLWLLEQMAGAYITSDDYAGLVAKQNAWTLYTTLKNIINKIG